jgi:hypothetical protein
MLINYLGVVTADGGRLAWAWEAAPLLKRFASRQGLDDRVAELLAERRAESDATSAILARLTGTYILVGITYGACTYCAVASKGHELALDALLTVFAKAVQLTCGVANPSVLTKALLAKHSIKLRLMVKEFIVQGDVERDDPEQIVKAASLLASGVKPLSDSGSKRHLQ